MSFVLERKVKGISYYYLEEAFKEWKHWTKESVYLGNKKPNTALLLKAWDELKRKCETRNHLVLIPPLTKYIKGMKARKLEETRVTKLHFLKKLTPEQRKEFTQRERIKFITESNAIEGSSLTYHTTEQIIAQEKRLEKKKDYVITGTSREEQEAINLNACLDRYDKYLQSNIPISEKMILQQHYVLLEKIENYEKYQGIFRPVHVYLRGSTHEFPAPEYVPSLMKKLLEWHNENENLIHPVELAAKFHTQFTSIHPFADGNGRIARLMMNYILQQKTYPFTNIPLKRRNNYMKTQAEANIGNHKSFTLFLSQEIIKQHLKPSIKTENISNK